MEDSRCIEREQQLIAERIFLGAKAVVARDTRSLVVSRRQGFEGRELSRDEDEASVLHGNPLGR